MILEPEVVEHLLSELKRANSIINGVVSTLVKIQSKKLSRAATDEDLEEYRTIKEIVSNLKSVA